MYVETGRAPIGVEMKSGISIVQEGGTTVQEGITTSQKKGIVVRNGITTSQKKGIVVRNGVTTVLQEEITVQRGGITVKKEVTLVKSGVTTIRRGVMEGDNGVTAQITLKRGKEQSVKRYHPWIFSGAVASVEGKPLEGDTVEVYDSEGGYLATGHWAPGSIAVRIISFTKERLDTTFYRGRLEEALRYRITTGVAGESDTTVWRLLHGEGDGIPGLVIDIYGNVAVMQAHTAGIWRIRSMIAALLPELTGGVVRSVYDKSAGTLPHKANLNPVNGYLNGGDDGAGGAVVTENGFRFRVDWEKGQKTGFFIDQRDSRSLLKEYTADKEVLNMFGYTGAFSVYALSNAAAVTTVDSSAAAIAMAGENVELNYGNERGHRSVVADAFSFLAGEEREYDIIVVDPPAFAKHLSATDQALKGYRRLNALAMRKIRPGGMLFTFSCSQAVSREQFRRSLFVAAAGIGRRVRIMHQTGQPADHPVSLFHPESEYLKGVVLYIE